MTLYREEKTKMLKCKKTKSTKWLVIFIISIFYIFEDNASFAYSGGTGEPNNPYQIANIADLLEFAYDEPNYNKCFLLTADIDLNNLEFNAAVIAPDISNDIDFQGVGFNGIFEGAGHKIKNLKIDTEDILNSYMGLFGLIYNSDPETYYEGEVNNLHLENVSIKAGEILYYSGGLVGSNQYGYIHNCSTTGTINVNGNGSIRYIGGLIGYNNSDYIINCSSSVDVNGGFNLNTDSLGGLIGFNYGNVNNCSANGTVKIYARGPFYHCIQIGGLIGWNSYGNIIDSCSGGLVIGDVEGVWQGADIGGLIGTSESGLVSGCYSSCTVVGAMSSSGGLVGCNFGSSINECISTGSVSGDDNVGGLVGYNTGYINKSFSIGYACGDSSIGGFVGSNESSGHINNCYSMGSVGGGNYIRYTGGFAGTNYGTIGSCYSTGRIIINLDYDPDTVGGFLGYGGMFYGSFWDVNTSNWYYSAGGEGKTTAEMKKRSTFVNAGWDFVCETTNGTEDIWWMYEDFNYPMLTWFEFPDGFNVNNKSMNFYDFAILGLKWLQSDISFCNGGMDLDGDGFVNYNDLAIFAENWLSE